ncbi:hypothetical protein [Paracoccus sp. JM45]|nr:hypothetical protein [Paracoccus sp. JM45]
MHVPADLVMTAVELARAGIAADTMVTITSFPTNTAIASNN